MSKDIKTLAVMIANRAADIEATEQLEKKHRLEAALEAFCRVVADGKAQPIQDEEL